MNTPLVCYPTKNQSYILHSDICPHQGASLSRGWLNEEGNLHCPYHGFEFCKGMFCKIPNPILDPKSFHSKTILPLYPTILENNILFMYPNHTIPYSSIPKPFFPPEETDTMFRSVEGHRIIDNDYLTICENLLDMLHISYVHSFGSSITPLPHTIKYKNLSKTSGQSEFYYQPRDFTISGKVGRVSKVVVQNEFHLPANTVTRVKAGKTIKTVFTRSMPISENKTLLFWKVYRNFWIDPYFDTFSWLGDFVMNFLMEKTIDEDVNILKQVYPEHRVGHLRTKYDITIRNFRKALAQFEDQ